MRHDHIMVGLTLASVSLFGLGCQNPIDAAKDQVVNKVVESETGGKVNVDSANNTVTTVGQDGTKVAYGENVALPDNLPADMPVYPGAKTSVVSFDASGKNGGLTQTTSDDPQHVYDTIVAKMKGLGFTMTVETKAENVWIVGFKKGTVTVSVSVSKGNDGTTAIILGRSEQ